MSIETKIIKAIENCSLCNGSLHYEKDGKSVRCKCFLKNRFLYLFRKAKIKDSLIKKEIANIIREFFVDQPTVCLEIAYDRTRQIYVNSAAYEACKRGYSTRIYTDEDVISSVFDKANTDEGSSPLDRYIEPDFLILQIGYIKNRDFIGGHIRIIFEKRESYNKKTLIITPGIESVKLKYEDSRLDEYLGEELRTTRKALYGIPKFEESK